jgi:hypothetical protein
MTLLEDRHTDVTAKERKNVCVCCVPCVCARCDSIMVYFYSFPIFLFNETSSKTRTQSGRLV